MIIKYYLNFMLYEEKKFLKIKKLQPEIISLKDF